MDLIEVPGRKSVAWVKNLLAWRAEVDRKHREHNETVQSRQVVRRERFDAEFARVNEKFGGEPRKARRGIARTIVQRAWKARKHEDQRL